MLIRNSEEKGTVDQQMTVLLHYWQLIRDTDVSWEYFEEYTSEPAYYYKNSEGLLLNIINDRGRSKVIKSVGIPENIVEMLNNCDVVGLKQTRDEYLKHKIIDSSNLELRIVERYE